MDLPKTDPEIEKRFRLYKPENRPIAGKLQRLTGGFSGADVYCFEALSGNYVLRLWPANFKSSNRIQELGLFAEFLNHNTSTPVAGPLRNLQDQFYFRWDDRLAQIEPFLAGQPIDSQSPSQDQIDSAMKSLAECHLVCANYMPSAISQPRILQAGWGSSESLQLRLRLLNKRNNEFEDSFLSHSNGLKFDEKFPQLVDQLSLQLQLWKPIVLQNLQTQARQLRPVLPVFRDVWREHLLFVDGQVSGIIDINASATDSIACDLTRYLGSVLGNDSKHWRAALQAYQTVRPLQPVERESLLTFDLSNLLLSSVGCLERCLIATEESIRASLLVRLQGYVSRLQNYHHLQL
ncbi:MAG TPA: hypothetical protein DD473_21840 [Planctomycetaceae bacterium]|nr:hypothetical protein [Planctomycetaceae bacterium]